MATQNVNQITAPRVDLIDENTGKIRREWYMFLYNLYTITGAGSGITPVINGGTGLGTIPLDGQLLIGNGTGYTLNTLGFGAGISIVNASGAITIANTGVLSNIAGTGIAVSSATGNVTVSNTGVLSFSGGSTGLTPATATTGAVSLGGKLAIGYGGTNATATPTAGAIAYGTGTAYGFTLAGTTNQALLSAGAGTPTWNTLTTGSSILYGNGSGLFSNVTIGSGVSFSGGILSATGTGGTVTAVTASTPLASSGGPTPNLTIQQSNTSQSGYLSYTDWNTFNSKQPAGTYVNSVTGTAPVVSSGGVNPAISMAAATASVNGYLTSADWSTFNSKQPAGAYLTSVTSDAPLTGAGTAASHLSIPAATTSVNGYLTSTDWNTFNGKQPAGTYVTSVTGTAPVVSSGGTTPAISMAAASTSVNGYLTSTDWNTFNGKGSGSVTTVSVVSANGFAGTVATATTTPAITLTTTITGLLKGNGTAISAAVANTDYVPLSTVLTKTADYTITGTDTWIINNKSGSALTLTFPAASSWTGRSITVKNMQAQLVNSASSNIVPIDSTTAGTAILLNVVGNWATMVSDGTNWVIMQAASNNNLLLE